MVSCIFRVGSGVTKAKKQNNQKKRFMDGHLIFLLAILLNRCCIDISDRVPFRPGGRVWAGGARAPPIFGENRVKHIGSRAPQYFGG